MLTKMDRFARSVRDFIRRFDQLKDKGVTLRILNLGLDSSTATGKLMLTVMAGVAEFEREMLLERQAEPTKPKAAKRKRPEPARHRWVNQWLIAKEDGLRQLARWMLITRLAATARTQSPPRYRRYRTLFYKRSRFGRSNDCSQRGPARLFAP
jgi:DNA invertase Pin-like site-specific DNA recombinase